MTVKRDIVADNLKAILIILVVLGHVMGFMRVSKLTYLINCIYSFHMPAFVFINGYLLSSLKFKKMKTIIFQFAILQIIYIVFFYEIGYYHSINMVSLLTPAFHLWYLFAYVAWELIIGLLNQLRRRNGFAFIIGIFLFMFLAFYSRYISTTVNSQFLTYTRIFVFLPFFLLGYYCKDFFKKQFINKYIASIVMVALMCSVIVLTYAMRIKMTEIFWGFPHMHDLNMNFPTFTFLQIYQYFVALMMVFLLMQVISKKTHKYTQLTNEVTFIYLFHPFFAALLIQFNFNQYALKINLLLSVLFTALIVAILLFGKKSCIKIISSLS
ncbi:acyltransferase family protein [Lactiplantibacillus pentosus]|uniref:acyltransferase family protein n=1 Tax=Lactiplantibacillus pentosus TaxID=1589 RepID=UPI001C1F5777|nr:acyltransferase family protein [Lactiplantibacillus pentosus]